MFCMQHTLEMESAAVAPVQTALSGHVLAYPAPRLLSSERRQASPSGWSC